MIKKDYDLVVVGGGMSGFSAAYTAANNGCNVLIVEKKTCLGGLATSGLVIPFMGLKAKPTNVKIIAGNLDKIRENLKSYFPEAIENKESASFNPECMKYALEFMATESGVNILYDSVATNVNVKNSSIVSIDIFNKSGFANIKSKYFIDATGDADIAYKAGVPCAVGRESYGKNQAYSLRFIVGNIDVKKAQPQLNNNREELAELMEKSAKTYDLPIMDNGMQNFIVPGRDDCLAFNAPRILDTDATNGESLSRGYILAHKLIIAYVDILRKNIAGCKRAIITNTAETMGVRDSRRIQGKHVLTRHEVAQGYKFEDGICGNCWYIDIHNPDGKGASEIIFPKGGYNDVPYSSLYSNEIDNLLVAGRCISSDHNALASVRIMPTCIATGQAAGMAVSMACNKSIKTSQVDTDVLRKRLAADGALISGINL